MAAAASSSFEPTMSTNFIRAPLSSAEAVSMADTLPSVNFGFDNLRERMAQFTARFDDFIEKGRKKVLEDRNEYRTHIAELRGMFCCALCQRLINVDITACEGPR